MPVVVVTPARQQHLLTAACLLLVLGPLYVASQSTTFVAYPFVLGATRCYSCGLGNYSNQSGAEVSEQPQAHHLCLCPEIHLCMPTDLPALTMPTGAQKFTPPHYFACPQTCQACPPGTYTQLNESTGCWPCPNKTYAPSFGMASCLPCTTVDYQGASVCPPPPIITTFFGNCIPFELYTVALLAIAPAVCGLCMLVCMFVCIV